MTAKIDHERDLHLLQARDWRIATAAGLDIAPVRIEQRRDVPADFLNDRPGLRRRFLNALTRIARP